MFKNPIAQLSIQKLNYKDSIAIYQEILDGAKTKRAKALVDKF